MRGWQVPAYTFPENLTDMAVMRIVIRNGFSMDLANLLLDDFRLHLRILEHHPQTQTPPELQKKRESFAPLTARRGNPGGAAASGSLPGPGGARGSGRTPGRPSS